MRSLEPPHRLWRVGRTCGCSTSPGRRRAARSALPLPGPRDLLSPKSHAFLNSCYGNLPAQRRVAGEPRAFKGHDKEAAVGQMVLRFNEVLRRQAGAHGVEVVDLYEPSQREVPRHPELISVDGYHPSDYGYARWAALMWQGIAARIPRATLPRGPAS